MGIGSGAYSSIFLAAPLLAALKEREPEFARRRDDLGALAGVSSVGGVLAEEAQEIAAADGDGEVVEEDEQEAEVAARPAPVAAPPVGPVSSKRERRRQRRASRPHGRAR